MFKVINSLADNVIHNKIPANFEGTVADVEDALREEIRKLIPDYNAFRRYRYDVYEQIHLQID